MHWCTCIHSRSSRDLGHHKEKASSTRHHQEKFNFTTLIAGMRNIQISTSFLASASLVCTGASLHLRHPLKDGALSSINERGGFRGVRRTDHGSPKRTEIGVRQRQQATPADNLACGLSGHFDLLSRKSGSPSAPLHWQHSKATLTLGKQMQTVRPTPDPADAPRAVVVTIPPPAVPPPEHKPARPSSNTPGGKHYLIPNFPKNPSCEICKRTKVTRVPCRRGPEH